MRLFVGVVVASACLLAMVAAEGFIGGRFLDPPVPAKCPNRIIHERIDGKGFYYSWRDPAKKDEDEDWLGARNFCRHMCMDLVSLQTKAKNEFFKNKLVSENVKYIWTSGRLCTFKGCDRPDLKPVEINGWFWSAENLKLAPTTDRVNNDWSHTGGIGKPQPDNREPVQQNGGQEECLALLNNKYNDGVHWHDVACHHRKPFVCEDSEALIKYVMYKEPRTWFVNGPF
uniref:C-type lectin domain-containing protein n=1 Tax=Cacopsylla melanoneura TaxID=428564 RepID=A0A8D8Z3X1_9HEMI